MKIGLLRRDFLPAVSDHNRVLQAMASFWPLALPLLLLAPGFNSFTYRSEAALYSDLAISHYPNAVYLIQSLKEWHIIPLWSSTILSGYPFFADPLSGLWYPPGWIALIFPLPLGFNLTIALHLLWGGIGMYRFMRSDGIRHTPAIYAALAFECLPKVFAHFGAGHLTLIYAFAWTPWLLFAVNEHRMRKITSRLSPGVILAMIFLADPRWAFYAGILWVGYTLFARQIFSIRYYSKQAAIAVLLAAPLALPLLQYILFSTRSNLVARDVLAFSLPFEQILGMLFPPFDGSHEYVFYPGGVVLVLALVYLLNTGPSRQKKFWLAVLALSVFLSLGEHIPFLRLLAKLPGFSLLRVPPRSLFLAGIAMIVLAASALEERSVEKRATKRETLLGLTALNGFALAMAAGAWALLKEFPASFAWGAVSIFIASVWLVVNLLPQISFRIWWLGLLAISLVDWGYVDLQQFHFRAADQVFSEGLRTAAYLSGDPEPFRIYSPSYSLPQQAASRFGLQLVDGVDPLQLEAYARFMSEAGGYQVHGYSVTLPPFEDGNPSQANVGAVLDTKRLGLLNAKYVVSEYDLSIKDLALRKQFGDTRVYENLKALPRAWLQPPGTELGEGVRNVRLDLRSPNRIVLDAVGPGMLVLSEISYPGWRASIDGHATAISTTGSLLRSVALAPGEHRIVFSFRPAILFLGLGLALLGIVLALGKNP